MKQHDNNEAMRLAGRISPETDWYEFDQVTWCNEAAALLRKQAERTAELEADYQRLMDKHNALHVNALKHRTDCDTLRAEVERLRKLCVEQAQSLIERPVMDIDAARKATQ